MQWILKIIESTTFVLTFVFCFCHTWSCVVKTFIFLVCLCYWPNSFMKGDEGGIFSKAPDRKPLLLTQAAQTRNIGPIPEVKKNLHWPIMISKMLHIGKNLSKPRCWQTSLVCPKYSWRVWGWKILQFLELILETVFPALKLTRNCYLNMKIYFS